MSFSKISFLCPGKTRGASLFLSSLVFLAAVLIITGPAGAAEKPFPRGTQSGLPRRARDLGIHPGRLEPGKYNAITDVPGVLVGHRTLFEGKNVRTGVTAILPHSGNIFLDKVPAAVAVGNGFGKLAGSTQVEELGNIETPVILTNTLSVGTAVKAVVEYTLNIPGNSGVRSVNAVVGETNDGYLNDIRSMRVKEEDVLASIESASGGPVEEGCAGAGTGTVAFGFKGGIGTSSRIVKTEDEEEYVLGTLVQTNYGGNLRIDGVPIELDASTEDDPREEEGSCMIVIATDAPVSARNLKRLARRALLGLARTGSYMSNGSGDYVIAFSTAYRIRYGAGPVEPGRLLSNNSMNPLFEAVAEAVEEAVYNSLFAAATTTGYRERTIRALPAGKVRAILNERGYY